MYAYPIVQAALELLGEEDPTKWRNVGGGTSGRFKRCRGSSDPSALIPSRSKPA